MKREPPKILVVGSLVMDLITSTEKIPGAGETVIGCGFATAPGGKGANQAYQAAKLGAQVTMVGKVGEDIFGHTLTDSLKAVGADVSHILFDPTSYSATGCIQLLKKDGRTLNNRIIVAPGANLRLVPEDVAFLQDDIVNYDMVILQMEIPPEINALVAGWAASKGVPVMLNPAPSAPLAPALLSALTYISPNEHEAADITGIRLTGEDGAIDCDALDRALRDLRNKGVPNIIITLGAQGCVLDCQASRLQLPCVPGVDAVDPTAAGDSFIGAFCVGVAAGLTQKDALTLATHTAAITVSRMGAQPSLPSLEEVLADMTRRECSPELIATIQTMLGD